MTRSILRRPGHPDVEGDFGGAREVLVPRPLPPMVATGLPPPLPVEVLLDRYNAKYDHHFPEVDVERDVFRLSGREGDALVYAWNRVETTKVRLR